MRRFSRAGESGRLMISLTLRPAFSIAARRGVWLGVDLRIFTPQVFSMTVEKGNSFPVTELRPAKVTFSWEIFRSTTAGRKTSWGIFGASTVGRKKYPSKAARTKVKMGRMNFIGIRLQKKPASGDAGFLKRRGRSLDHGLDELLELHDVSGEGADPLRCFLGGHGVFVELEAEGFFVVGDLVEVAVRRVGIELLLKRSVSILKLFEKSGRDGEKIATGKGGDLTDITERSAHDFGLVAVLLVVVVDLGHGKDAGIFVAGVFLARVVLIPVVDTTDER